MSAKKIILAGCMILVMTGLSQAQQTMNSGKAPVDTTVKAIAELYPTAGNQAHGTVIFTMVNEGIKMQVHIEGLKPGLHGFHIHQYGDCSSADGSSAGGHFNPDQMVHGGPMDSNRHAGDMGNIEADSNGVANLELVDNQMSFSGPHSIIGRGIVIHANSDDLKTQPSGNSGSRIACGVIGIAK
jgi:superoxide dismutase, Cu-Zn family